MTNVYIVETPSGHRVVSGPKTARLWLQGGFTVWRVDALTKVTLDKLAAE